MQVDLMLDGGWESKGTYIFYLELVTDVLHLFVYVIFFIIVFTNYGLPLHLVRAACCKQVNQPVYMCVPVFICACARMCAWGCLIEPPHRACMLGYRQVKLPAKQGNEHVEPILNSIVRDAGDMPLQAQCLSLPALRNERAGS